MSQSSDNPVRQARRRGWAQRVLPPDARRRQEMREIAQKMSHEELDEITRIWLAGVESGEQGDQEARDLMRGTFGPWAAELLRLRRH